MCEIHRLTTNTCLTQVLIFKYHKVMNKIPLSGFCLLLKSRHKHLFSLSSTYKCNFLGADNKQ